MITAQGSNGQISFDGLTITITRNGFLARTTRGKGSRSYDVRSVGALELKPAGFSVGYVKLSVQGEAGKGALVGRRAATAAGDEYALTFSKKLQDEFEDKAEAMREAIRSIGQPVAAVDPVEQFRKLAELRYSGVITAEEFEPRKADILAGI